MKNKKRYLRFEVELVLWGILVINMIILFANRLNNITALDSVLTIINMIIASILIVNTDILRKEK